MNLLAAILCFGIIAGRNATTDGYVYLGHNEDQWGEQMLNIYNVPANEDRSACLWFEFPGQKSGDSFINEYGVCISSDQCLSREDSAEGSLVYEIRTTAIVSGGRPERGMDSGGGEGPALGGAARAGRPYRHHPELLHHRED